MKLCVLSQRTLEGRTAKLMNQLLAIGIGDRPIIFLAHSMGGLLVKNIIVAGKISILKRKRYIHIILKIKPFQHVTVLIQMSENFLRRQDQFSFSVLHIMGLH